VMHIWAMDIGAQCLENLDAAWSSTTLVSPRSCPSARVHTHRTDRQDSIRDPRHRRNRSTARKCDPLDTWGGRTTLPLSLRDPSADPSDRKKHLLLQESEPLRLPQFAERAPAFRWRSLRKNSTDTDASRRC